jgi:CheY-like chemotaxis protein
LLQLINDILDLAKVESGRAELHCGMLNVGKVLGDAQAIVKTLANKKGIHLEFNFSPELPPLYADEGKFKQILYNLLSNAIKFTPDGGAVTLTASLGIPGESLVISVADSGIGIKPEDQHRIFQEFEQVDSSYGRQQQGTGLGLALTRRLVEMHGGQIRVESEGVEGRGSVFTFVIPIHKLETRLLSPPAKQQLKFEMLRPAVLVFAKDDLNQEFMNDYLGSAGYEVLGIPDEEALDKSLGESTPYAVVAFSENFNSQKELLEYRSKIPLEIPLVIFSFNGQEMPEFRLFTTEGPIQRSAAKLNDAIRGSRRSSGRELKTALIIDDEVSILDLLGITLVKKGICVLRAVDGHTGVELARKHVPDVLILDLGIPDFDGRQIVEELRADARTKAIPVLIHTGATPTEEQRQSLATHVRSITFKSDQDVLLAEIDRLETMTDHTLELEETV